MPPFCLSLKKATRCVADSCPIPPTDISQTLREVGVIDTADQDIFKDNVRDKVKAAGCRIRRNQIPSDPDTQLRDVINTVQDKAQSPEAR